MNFDQIIRRAVRTVDNNAPVILTGISVAGTITTAILAAKATPGMLRDLEIQRLNKDNKWIVTTDNIDSEAQLTKLEKLRYGWMHYIPAIGVGIITVTCTVGSQSINARRQAALISGVTIIDTAFKEYREKVADQFGVKGEEKVRDAIAQDKVNALPINSEVVILGKGDVLCLDSISERYFMSDMESLRQAQNDLNQELIQQNYASLNDFYQMVGLKPTSLGNEMGWNSDVMLDLSFSARISDDKRPCIVINYNLAPVRDYYKFG